MNPLSRRYFVTDKPRALGTRGEVLALGSRDATRKRMYKQRDKRGRKARVARVYARRGLCGEYNDSGQFVPCGSTPARVHTFCVQCKRYYHLGCFVKLHNCYAAS